MGRRKNIRNNIAPLDHQLPLEMGFMLNTLPIPTLTGLFNQYGSLEYQRLFEKHARHISLSQQDAAILDAIDKVPNPVPRSKLSPADFQEYATQAKLQSPGLFDAAALETLSLEEINSNKSNLKKAPAKDVDAAAKDWVKRQGRKWEGTSKKAPAKDADATANDWVKNQGRKQVGGHFSQAIRP
jgi:hypothetical protein